MRQADIMTTGEGDAWYARNKDRLGERDPVSDMIDRLAIRPKHVLEIGCANGWRLAKLRDKYGSHILGVEPSMQAGIDAASLRVPVVQMTASTLPETTPKFDLVIYGFCLYLTDPKDWFHIVAAGDAVLCDGGHIIIHDFEPPVTPFAKRYEHRNGMLSYHVRFSALWLAHPLYEPVMSDYSSGENVVALQKRSLAHIPVLPS